MDAEDASSMLLNPAHNISDESVVPNAAAPTSSLEILAQMVSQASARQKQDKLDSTPHVLDPVAPAPKARKDRQSTDVIKKTSFTIPSMSGFWKQPFSLLPIASEPSPVAPVQEESVPSPPKSVSLSSWAWSSAEKDISFVSQSTVPDPAIQPQQVKHTARTGAPPPNQKRMPFVRRKWAFPFIVIVLFALLLSGVLVYANKSAATRGVGTVSASHLTPAGGNVNRGNGTQNGAGNGNSGVSKGVGNGNTHSATPDNTGSGSRSFQVGAHPLLVINGHGGNVNIHAGGTGTLMVTARQEGKINGAGVQYTQANDGQDHDRIGIATNLGAKNVDYDITVPSATQVQVQVAGGSIAVNGISGVTIDTGGGNMDIENVHGPVNVHTENGDITGNTLMGVIVMEVGNGGSIRLNSISGSLKAVSHSGDVIVRGGALNGTSILETNYGSVRFEGSIDPQGSYTLKTINGSISLTLPVSTAFQLATSVGSGSVNNDFGNTVVGYAPRAQITATIGSGSVTINKAV